MPLMGPVTVMSPITDLGYKPPLNPSSERENFPQQTATSHLQQSSQASEQRESMAVRTSDDVIEDGAPLHQMRAECVSLLSYSLSYSPSPSLLWLSLRWLVSFVTRPQLSLRWLVSFVTRPQLVAVGIESSAPCTAGWSSLLGVSPRLQC
jgi:hypothetical protein